MTGIAVPGGLACPVDEGSVRSVLEVLVAIRVFALAARVDRPTAGSLLVNHFNGSPPGGAALALAPIPLS